MKKLQIKSFDDPHFLKLGFICIGLSLIILLASYIFNFSGIIAFRAGGGLGLLICITYAIAQQRKK
ncbi:hypothetical protein K2X30_04895 [bacterium]|jgi:hypothetical protein|nr:hypothetical protein [bacterium]